MSESQTPWMRLNDLLVKSNKQDLTSEEEIELKILTLLAERSRESQDRDSESDSIVASCTCLTKTNDIQYHKPGCKYRLIVERDQARARLAELEGIAEEMSQASVGIAFAKRYEDRAAAAQKAYEAYKGKK